MYTVMLVDDNKMYRQAFTRFLEMNNYQVVEAENRDEAMTKIREQVPEVVITDLEMRSREEGLQLIRDIRSLKPFIPIIMISAVGTFEEGAKAIELGANQVISKSRIDQEIDYLYSTIDNAMAEYKRKKSLLALVRDMRERLNRGETREEDRGQLSKIIDDKQMDEYIRTEAYDALLQFRDRQFLDKPLKTVDGWEEISREIVQEIGKKIHNFSQADQETKRVFITAEYMFNQQEQEKGMDIDFSRNIAFSYAFAVENEVKLKMKSRMVSMLKNRAFLKMVNRLYDEKLKNVDLFLHQYLLQLMRGKHINITIDNVRHTLQYILKLEGRYRPDGLKAVGTLLLLFARNYEVITRKGIVKIKNPMGIHTNSEEVLELAKDLINLQHFRNPYIHPDVSETEKLGQIRTIAKSCLLKLLI